MATVHALLTMVPYILTFYILEGLLSDRITNPDINTPQTVYSLISQVFQDVYLFDDTIYNNIKIGNPNATEKEILQVAEKAQVTEFLGVLENGINTKVGEGGSKLSGGQKQRISIARAMLKDAQR